MRWRIGLVLAGALAARCGSPQPAAAATMSTQTVFTGMCDASGAVALDAHHFAVANDEDNIIRIYRAENGGPPVQSLDLSGFLKVDPRKPETDLEGACWLGDRVFWISSHARNHSGLYRPNRVYLLATSFQKTASGFRLIPEGKPYHRLLEDLLREPRLKPFKLQEGSRQATKSPGALNIEGIAGTPEGHLLIGFRSPVPGGRALLVPLINPNEVVAGQGAKFGDPILLDLRGRGVRDIARWRDGYLISAGPADSGDDFALYIWASGAAKPKQVKGVRLKHFHAEAIVVYPDQDEKIQLLSDDGARMRRGMLFKGLLGAGQQQFRGIWVTLPKKED